MPFGTIFDSLFSIRPVLKHTVQPTTGLSTYGRETSSVPSELEIRCLRLVPDHFRRYLKRAEFVWNLKSREILKNTFFR